MRPGMGKDSVAGLGCSHWAVDPLVGAESTCAAGEAGEWASQGPRALSALLKNIFALL